MRLPILLVLAASAALGLTSCATTYTLSPAVKESARRYSDVMDDFADQALLANVLRAKDYAPMNFNDLSSITGSLSLSSTLGLTFPFGLYNGNPGPIRSAPARIQPRPRSRALRRRALTSAL